MTTVKYRKTLSINPQNMEHGENRDSPLVNRHHALMLECAQTLAFMKDTGNVQGIKRTTAVVGRDTVFLERDSEKFQKTGLSVPLSTTQSERGCRCAKSHCLMLYCSCFRSMQTCSAACTCTTCKNDGEHEKEFLNAVKLRSNGCRCKNSHCVKKYCECFRANSLCTVTCACEHCLNFVPRVGTHEKATPTISKGIKKNFTPVDRHSIMNTVPRVGTHEKATPTISKGIKKNFTAMDRHSIMNTVPLTRRTANASFMGTKSGLGRETSSAGNAAEKTPMTKTYADLIKQSTQIIQHGLDPERMHDTEVTPAKCNGVSAMILAQALAGSNHSGAITIPSQNSAFSPWTRAQA